MFNNQKNFMRLNGKNGNFVFNGKEAQAGASFTGEVIAVSMEWQYENKEYEIPEGYTVKIQLESEAGDTQFELPLRLFYTKKFLCYLPNIKTPFITLSPKAETKDDKVHISILTGARSAKESHYRTTEWAKAYFKFDGDGDIFNSKAEIVETKDILEAWCTMYSIPFSFKQKP